MWKSPCIVVPPESSILMGFSIMNQPFNNNYAILSYIYISISTIYPPYNPLYLDIHQTFLTKPMPLEATDPADIQTSIEKLRALRFEAKGQLQRHCGASPRPPRGEPGDGSWRILPFGKPGKIGEKSGFCL